MSENTDTNKNPQWNRHHQPQAWVQNQLPNSPDQIITQITRI